MQPPVSSDTPHPRPFRVVRWGKFWSLEPLFADERSFLVAKGSLPPRLDELVLALPARGNRWQIVASLGMADEVDAVLRALLYAQEIRQGFDDEVLAEVAAVAPRAARPDGGRVDLTALPTFTIDPDSARDFDDAISVAREDAGYRVHVHIADVSYFVDSGGAIDLEARERTSSVYLPLWAEPMLPPALSSDLCSLRPGEERKCLTVEFTFAEDGERRGAEFYRSVIRSDHRLTYGVVDALLEGNAAGESGEDAAGGVEAVAVDAVLRERIALAHELAEKLRRRRFARGALQLGSFEPEFSFDTEGALAAAVARLDSASHQLVEEYMLAANEAVAAFLLHDRGQAIYRVHEPPAAASAAALFAMMDELDVPTPAFAGEKASDDQISAALRRLNETMLEVTRREGRGRLAFPQLLLRSLKQAYYSPENLGHFGLASGGYLHFTSPIRRYPDLVVHRALLAHLGLDGAELGSGELASIASLCSTQERTISKLELKADDIALGFLLERQLREQGWETVFEGEIIGSIGGGIFVHFGGCFEGYLPVRELGDDWFVESPQGSAQIGERSGQRYRLGDAIAVRVEHVDRLHGKVDLRPAGPGHDDEAGGRARTQKVGSGPPKAGERPGRGSGRGRGPGPKRGRHGGGHARSGARTGKGAPR